MEGIKAHAKIGKIPGQADSFKVCVESPLCHFIVCQGINDFLRDMFSLRKVNDLHLAAIDRITEEQNFKVRRLRVFVNAALIQIDVREGFYIYTDVFQSDHLNSNRRPKIAPKPPAAFVLLQGLHALLVVLAFMFGLFLLTLHAFLMVLEVTGGRFLLALFTLAVVEEVLDGRDQDHDAEDQPDGDQRSKQDCL